MTRVRHFRLYLPSLVFGLWAVVRGVGITNHWLAAGFLTALAVGYAAAERARRPPA